MEDTELGGARRTFRSTLWTQVLKAKDAASPDRRAALEQLIQVYWKPVYSFLRRRGHAIESAKDFTQGFFAAFLEKDYLKYVQKERGKFRTFLRTALEHYVADEFDRARAKKRGGGAAVFSLDFGEAERDLPRDPGPDDTPDAVYRRQWALLVLERALRTLQGEFEAAGKKEEFEVFRVNLGLGDAPSYADVARRLGISVTDVKNRLHRTRKRYREAILEEIRSYTSSDEEAQEELRDLFAAFS